MQARTIKVRTRVYNSCLCVCVCTDFHQNFVGGDLISYGIKFKISGDIKLFVTLHNFELEILSFSILNYNRK